MSPAEVVSAAAAAGVELFALSDHDTTAGVPEAQDRASELGIDLVSAVEITSTFEERHDLHVLGYLIDPANRAWKRCWRIRGQIANDARIGWPTRCANWALSSTRLR